MEIRWFRAPRLRRDHALGHSGGDADVIGISNHTLEFFCEYSGNEASSMSQPLTEAKTDFDAYAATYDAALARGLSISGEDKNYFARGRIVWVARCSESLAGAPRIAMDFGCGTWSRHTILIERTDLESLVGVDDPLNHWRLRDARMVIAPALFLLQNIDP